jgi:hypothetical protein
MDSAFDQGQLPRLERAPEVEVGDALGRQSGHSFAVPNGGKTPS